MLRSKGSESWAYITAYNPFSELLSDEENEKRNKELESKLTKFEIFSGRGVGTDGTWSDEESFLVLGISRNDAMELGKKFEQNAILFGTIDDVPELICIEAK